MCSWKQRLLSVSAINNDLYNGSYVQAAGEFSKPAVFWSKL